MPTAPPRNGVPLWQRPIRAAVSRIRSIPSPRSCSPRCMRCMRGRRMDHRCRASRVGAPKWMVPMTGAKRARSMRTSSVRTPRLCAQPMRGARTDPSSFLRALPVAASAAQSNSTACMHARSTASCCAHGDAKINSPSTGSGGATARNGHARTPAAMSSRSLSSGP